MRSPTPARYLHPSNVLTYGSLLAGLLSLAAAREPWGRNGVGGLMALSVLLDTLDGRFASRFARSSDEQAFGVQLDSLADAATFGFAPVACLLLLAGAATSPLALAGWAAGSLLYLVCALTRLGCYNLHQAGGGLFIGIPAPLAALALSALLLMRPSLGVAAAALVALAAAMVAPLPVPRPRGAGMAAFVAVLAVILALHLWQASG